MKVIDHIDRVKDYCRDHLDIKLTEFWLTREQVDRLVSEVNGIPLVKCKALEGNTEVWLNGLLIKTIGVHDRLCQHGVTSHFKDVNEVYCHDCRTMIGQGVAETHRRHSNIGTN